MTNPQPRIGVVRFPGACDDRDALWALAALGADAVFVWHTETDLSELDAIVLRYAEPVNGSSWHVAGVVNEQGNVMGLMPHPEHAVDSLLGSADGALILSSLVDSARERRLAPV